jgi:hypothetical protein
MDERWGESCDTKWCFILNHSSHSFEKKQREKSFATTRKECCMLCSGSECESECETAQGFYFYSAQ